MIPRGQLRRTVRSSALWAVLALLTWVGVACVDAVQTSSLGTSPAHSTLVDAPATAVAGFRSTFYIQARTNTSAVQTRAPDSFAVALRAASGADHFQAVVTQHSTAGLYTVSFLPLARGTYNVSVTLSGPTTNTRALQFDGTAQQVTCVGLTAITPVHPTASVWFKTTSSSNQMLYRYDDGSQGFGVQMLNGQLFCHMWTPTLVSILSPSTYSDGQWHHIACSFDGSFFTQYIDGAQTRQTTTTSSVSYSLPSLTIGNNPGSAIYFNGQLDEMQLWSVALAHETVQFYMTSLLQGTEANLVLALDFTSNLADLSPTNAQCTAVNTPTYSQRNSDFRFSTPEHIAASPFSLSVGGLPVRFSGPQRLAAEPLQNATWTLQDVNFDGSNRTQGGRHFSVTLYGQAQNISANVSDNEDGTYTVAYMGQQRDILQTWVQYDRTHTNAYSLAFNGVSSYVDLGIPGSLDVQRFTLQAYVRSNGTTGNGQSILRWMNNGYSLQLTATGHVQCAIYDDIGSATTVTSSRGAYNNDTWYHLSCTYDGNTLALYSDGQLDASVSKTMTISFVTNVGMRFGMQADGTLPFSGLIDEVRVWNRALSASEVSTTATAVLEGTESGLVGAWSFDEGTGSLLHDLTSNAYHGTGTFVSHDTRTRSLSFLSPVHVAGSPFQTVLEYPPYAPNSYANGTGLFNTTAGALTTVLITTVDIYGSTRSTRGGAFNITVTPTQSFASLAVEDLQDGTHSVQYNLTVAGSYSLHMQLVGAANAFASLATSPTMLVVLPATAANSLSALTWPSATTTPWTATAGEGVLFGLQLRDIYGNLATIASDAALQASSVSLASASVHLTPTWTTNNGSLWFGTVNATVAGVYTVQALLNGAPVQSSVHLDVSPAVVHVPQTLLPGVSGALISPVAGSGFSFAPQFRDVFGNNVSAAGVVADLSAALTPADSGLTLAVTQATKLVSANLTQSGTYALSLALGGVALPQSPVSVVVAAAATATPFTQVLNPPFSVVAGQQLTYTLLVRDGFANNRTDGTASIQLELDGTPGSILVSSVYAHPAVYVLGANVTVAKQHTVQVRADGVVSADSPIALTVVPAALHVASTHVSGQGLTEASAGQGAAVALQLRDVFSNNRTDPAPGAGVQASVHGAQNLTTSVTYLGSGLYAIAYNQTLAGTYSLSLTVDGTAVPGSPFSVQGLPGVDVSPVSRVFDLPAGDVVAGSLSGFTFFGVDPFANNLTSLTNYKVQMASTDATVQPTATSTGQSGTFRFSFNATRAGTYTASVATSAGVHVSNSPFVVTIVAGTPSATGCALLLPSSTTDAGTAPTVLIQARDAFGNNVTHSSLASRFAVSLQLQGSSSSSAMQVSHIAAGVYNVSVPSITMAGLHTLHATLDTLSLANSPAQLRVVASLQLNAAATRLQSIAPVPAVAGQLVTLTLQTVDVYGNNNTQGTVSDALSFRVSQSGVTWFSVARSDGTRTLAIRLNTTGDIALTIEDAASGAQLQDVPVVTVLPASVSASQTTATLLSLSLSASEAAQPTLRIQPRDRFGNPITTDLLALNFAGNSSLAAHSLSFALCADTPTTVCLSVANATLAGSWQLHVSVNGSVLASSPFSFAVAAAAASNSTSRVLSVTTGSADEPVRLHLLWQDAFGNNISSSSSAMQATVFVDGTQAPGSLVSRTVTTSGLLLIDVSLRQARSYSLALAVSNGTLALPAGTSVFSITPGALNLTTSQVLGVWPQSVIAGEAAVALIMQTVDTWGNNRTAAAPASVQLVVPAPALRTYDMTHVSQGQYAVSNANVTAAGAYTLQLRHLDQTNTYTGVELTVLPASADAASSLIVLPSQIRLDQQAAIAVHPRDAFGNAVTSAVLLNVTVRIQHVQSGLSAGAIQLQQLGNGTVKVFFVPVQLAALDISVLVNGTQVLTRQLDVLPTTQPIQSLRFDQTGTVVSLAFNGQLTISSGPVACTTLFETHTVDLLGPSPSCTVAASSITVLLGSGFALRPGTNMTIRNTWLLDPSTNQTYTHSLSAPVLVPLVGATASSTASIQAPQLVGKCAEVQLGVTALQGPLVLHYTWSLQSTTANASLPSVASLTALLATTDGAFVTIASSLLQPGANYTFGVRLTNLFAVNGSVVTKTVAVSPNDVPTVVVQGGTDQTVVFGNDLLVSSTVQQESLCASSNLGTLSLHWALTNIANQQSVALDAQLQGAAAIKLPTSVFTSIGQQFDLTLTVTAANDVSVSATAVVRITVTRPQLQAVIAGSNRTVARSAGTTLALDASSSNPKSLSGVQYHWNCAPACNGALSALSGPTVSANVASLSSGQVYSFTVIVEDSVSARNSSAVQLVTITDSNVPVLSIAPLSSNRIAVHDQLVLQASSSRAVSYVWSSSQINVTLVAVDGTDRGAHLILAANSLTAGTSYVFRVQGTDSSDSQLVGEASVQVYANVPPLGGSVTVLQRNGSLFQCRFAAWTDEAGDLPLRYALSYTRTGTSTTVWVVQDSVSPQFDFILPPDAVDASNNASMTAYVSDVYGARTAVTLTVSLTSGNPTNDALSSGSLSAAIGLLTSLSASADCTLLRQQVDAMAISLNAGNHVLSTADVALLRQELASQSLSCFAKQPVQASQLVLQANTLETVLKVPTEHTQSSLDQVALYINDTLWSAAQQGIAVDTDAAILFARSLGHVMAYGWNSTQHNQSQTVLTRCLEAVDVLMRLLSAQLTCGQAPANVDTAGFSLTLARRFVTQLDGSVVQPSSTASTSVASASIPSSVITSLANAPSCVDAQLVVWKTSPFLWQSNSSDVAANLVGFSVARTDNVLDTLTLSNLASPVQLTLDINGTGFGSLATHSIACEFFDRLGAQWSTSGCTLVSASNVTNTAVCSCTHLTEFGVRVVPSTGSTPTNDVKFDANGLVAPLLSVCPVSVGMFAVVLTISVLGFYLLLLAVIYCTTNHTIHGIGAAVMDNNSTHGPTKSRLANRTHLDTSLGNDTTMLGPGLSSPSVSRRQPGQQKRVASSSSTALHIASDAPFSVVFAHMWMFHHGLFGLFRRRRPSDVRSFSNFERAMVLLASVCAVMMVSALYVSGEHVGHFSWAVAATAGASAFVLANLFALVFVLTQPDGTESMVMHTVTVSAAADAGELDDSSSVLADTSAQWHTRSNVDESRSSKRSGVGRLSVTPWKRMRGGNKVGVTSTPESSGHATPGKTHGTFEDSRTLGTPLSVNTSAMRPGTGMTATPERPSTTGHQSAATQTRYAPGHLFPPWMDHVTMCLLVCFCLSALFLSIWYTRCLSTTYAQLGFGIAVGVAFGIYLVLESLKIVFMSALRVVTPWDARRDSVESLELNKSLQHSRGGNNDDHDDDEDEDDIERHMMPTPKPPTPLKAGMNGAHMGDRLSQGEDKDEDEDEDDVARARTESNEEAMSVEQSMSIKPPQGPMQMRSPAPGENGSHLNTPNLPQNPNLHEVYDEEDLGKEHPMHKRLRRLVDDDDDDFSDADSDGGEYDATLRRKQSVIKRKPLLQMMESFADTNEDAEQQALFEQRMEQLRKEDQGMRRRSSELSINGSMDAMTAGPPSALNFTRPTYARHNQGDQPKGVRKVLQMGNERSSDSGSEAVPGIKPLHTTHGSTGEAEKAEPVAEPAQGQEDEESDEEELTQAPALPDVAQRATLEVIASDEVEEAMSRKHTVVEDDYGEQEGEGDGIGITMDADHRRDHHTDAAMTTMEAVQVVSGERQGAGDGRGAAVVDTETGEAVLRARQPVGVVERSRSSSSRSNQTRTVQLAGHRVDDGGFDAEDPEEDEEEVLREEEAEANVGMDEFEAFEAEMDEDTGLEDDWDEDDDMELEETIRRLSGTDGKLSASDLGALVSRVRKMQLAIGEVATAKRKAKEMRMAHARAIIQDEQSGLEAKEGAASVAKFAAQEKLRMQLAERARRAGKELNTEKLQRQGSSGALSVEILERRKEQHGQLDSVAQEMVEANKESLASLEQARESERAQLEKVAHKLEARRKRRQERTASQDDASSNSGDMEEVAADASDELVTTVKKLLELKHQESEEGLVEELSAEDVNAIVGSVRKARNALVQITTAKRKAREVHQNYENAKNLMEERKQEHIKAVVEQEKEKMAQDEKLKAKIAARRAARTGSVDTSTVAQTKVLVHKSHVEHMQRKAEEHQEELDRLMAEQQEAQRVEEERREAQKRKLEARLAKRGIQMKNKVQNEEEKDKDTTEGAEKKQEQEVQQAKEPERVRVVEAPEEAPEEAPAKAASAAPTAENAGDKATRKEERLRRQEEQRKELEAKQQEELTAKQAAGSDSLLAKISTAKVAAHQIHESAEEQVARRKKEKEEEEAAAAKAARAKEEALAKEREKAAQRRAAEAAQRLKEERRNAEVEAQKKLAEEKRRKEEEKRRAAEEARAAAEAAELAKLLAEAEAEEHEMEMALQTQEEREQAEKLEKRRQQRLKREERRRQRGGQAGDDSA